MQIKAAAHIFFFISCSFTLSITQYIRSYPRMRLVAHGLYDYTVDEGEVQGVNRNSKFPLLSPPCFAIIYLSIYITFPFITY